MHDVDMSLGKKMNAKYEYRVCQLQNSRVTFVNGEWQGQKAIDAAATAEALESCPWVWDYLASSGWDGWELVGVAEQMITTEGIYGVVSSSIFLKKQM